MIAGILSLFSDFLTIPSIRTGAIQIAKRNLMQFQYSLKASLASTFIEPLLTLIVLGYGLGHFIEPIGGKTYIEFLVPGVAALTTMMMAFISTGYAMSSRLNEKNFYWTILQAPISPQELVVGEIIWGTCRGLASGAAVLALGGILGLVGSSGVLAIFVLLLTSIVFSAFAAIVACSSKNFNNLTMVQVTFLIPMTLFCETFFPVVDKATPLYWLVNALPLTQSTQATRALVSSSLTSQFFMNVAILVLLAVLTSNVAITRFQRRLLPD